MFMICACLWSEEYHGWTSVADPERVRGVQSNPPFSPNYFVFMGSFGKNWVNWSNRTPLSKSEPPFRKSWIRPCTCTIIKCFVTRKSMCCAKPTNMYFYNKFSMILKGPFAWYIVYLSYTHKWNILDGVVKTNSTAVLLSMIADPENGDFCLQCVGIIQFNTGLIITSPENRHRLASWTKAASHVYVFSGLNSFLTGPIKAPHEDINLTAQMHGQIWVQGSH